MSIQKTLAESPFAHDRERVAFDPQTPAWILDRLSQDTDVWVRAAVAKNPNATLNTLMRMTLDPETMVRYQMVVRTKSEAILRALHRDTNAAVRFLVAGASTVPFDVLLILAEDDDDDVRESALQNLDRRGGLLGVLGE